MTSPSKRKRLERKLEKQVKKQLVKERERMEKRVKEVNGFRLTEKIFKDNTYAILCENLTSSVEVYLYVGNKPLNVDMFDNFCLLFR